MNKKIQLLTRYHVLIILVAVVALFSILVRGFFSVSTLTNVLWSTSLVGIIAAGAIYPIITGGIDLSVGSIVGLSTVMMASLMSNAGLSFPVALLATLLVGALIGLFNGVLTIKLKLPAFVATLASQKIVRGIAMVWSGGKTIAIFNQPTFTAIATYKIFGVAFPVYLMLIITLLSYWLLSKHSFGRKILACGGNATASRLSCINVDTVCIIGYVLSGFCASITGVVLSSQTQQGRATMAEGYEMDVITAIVLGGAALSGGKGSIWGSLFGVVLVGIIESGMTMLNAPSAWHSVVKGAIILFAVAFNVFIDGLEHRQKKVKA